MVKCPWVQSLAPSLLKNHPITMTIRNKNLCKALKRREEQRERKKKRKEGREDCEREERKEKFDFFSYKS